MKRNGKNIRHGIAFAAILFLAGMLCACSYRFPWEKRKEAEMQEGPVIDTQKLGNFLQSFLRPEPDEDYIDHVYEGETLFRNKATWFFYREQLSETEKAIYDALIAISMDPTSTEYRKGVRTTADPEGEEFGRHVARAYQAMVFDHPELFWFRRETGQYSYYYEADPDKNGEWLVMFNLTAPYEEYEEQMTAFNAAVDAFLAGIDLTQEAPMVALDIHDALIDLVTYDSDLAEGTDVEPPFDFGFSAYGALVENSRGQDHTAVCDGYSYAYTYLLQQAGIPVVRVGGMVGPDMESLGAHSWNLVQLDGEWYEVDATWDDRDKEYDPEDPSNAIFLEAMADPYYWGKVRHVMFLRTTEEMRDFVPDDSYTYYNATGYATFLSPSVHIRDTEESAEVLGSKDYMSYLAPIATGTRYSYEELVFGVEETTSEAEGVDEVVEE